MLPITFINQVPATARLPRAVLYKTLAKADRLYHRQLADQHLAVVFMTESNIKKLNREYRHKARVTNVLSFPGETEGELGDIIICPAWAAPEAEALRQSFSTYVNYLFIHGLLHLLGFDHNNIKAEKSMLKAEAELK